MGKPPDDFETTARVPFKQLRPEIEIVDERKGATLTCLTQPRLGYVFRLNKGETVIGRAEDVDMQLKMAGVSRRHAAIKEEDIDVFIHPSFEKDRSLGSLSPVESERNENAIRTAKSKIRVKGVGDLYDLVRETFSDDQIVLASLKSGL